MSFFTCAELWSGDDDGSDDWSCTLDEAEDVVGNLCSLDESLGYSDGEVGRIEEYTVAPQLSLTKRETVGLYHLRKHLDKLKGHVDSHKQKVRKLR